MKPLPAEQVQQTAQITLAFLESPDTKIPGNLGDGIFSCKSLLRGLISGVLVVCQTGAPAVPPPPPPGTPPAATSPANGKNGRKKKAKKKGKTKP